MAGGGIGEYKPWTTGKLGVCCESRANREQRFSAICGGAVTRVFLKQMILDVSFRYRFLKKRERDDCDV